MTKPTPPPQSPSPSSNELEVMKDRAFNNSMQSIEQLINEANSDLERLMLATGLATLSLGAIHATQGEVYLDQFVKELVTEIKKVPLPLMCCVPDQLN